MTSEDNLSWLRETGRRYLVGTPKSELRKWARPIAEAQDWQAVREGVEAKQCIGPDGAETFVLVRSIERREKERAMHDRFGHRIEDGLARLGRRLHQARRPLDRGRLERQIGRLLALNSRAAGRYLVEFVPDPSVAAGVRLQWTTRPEWEEWARCSEGCYVLRSNVNRTAMSVDFMSASPCTRATRRPSGRWPGIWPRRRIGSLASRNPIASPSRRPFRPRGISAPSP